MCGTVLQHIIHPNSNWMHVRMQTRSVQESIPLLNILLSVCAISRAFSSLIVKTDGSFAALLLTCILLRMQANKAISRNGAVLGGSIMVGVTACTEAGVIIRIITR